jgi:hypothetical protein
MSRAYNKTLELSPHQIESKNHGGCSKCRMTVTTHCSWCGADFPTKDDLAAHLDLDCGARLARALANFGLLPPEVNPWV